MSAELGPFSHAAEMWTEIRAHEVRSVFRVLGVRLRFRKRLKEILWRRDIDLVGIDPVLVEIPPNSGVPKGNCGSIVAMLLRMTTLLSARAGAGSPTRR
ncbi:MAG: hypothetical protein WCF17_01625 [Terracidiphilus sp.]